MEQQPEKIKRVERSTEMPEEWQALRARILENFENKTDGLDIDRVREFAGKAGLPLADIVIFETGDIPTLQKMCGKLINLEDVFSADNCGGLYVSECEIAFALRNRNKEEEKGAVGMECTLVHELAHGVQSFQTTYIKNEEGEYINPRSGFDLETKTGKWGRFLEEGFAEVVSGRYRSEYQEDVYRQELKERLLKFGLSKDNVENFSELTFHMDSGSTYTIAKKYIFMDKTTKEGISWSAPSIAATGLDMLCRAEPQLWLALVEARKSVEGLREIPKLINGIEDGLYLKIQKCDYTEKDFARVQNIIKEAIQNSK